jgi:hypothetical protein
VNDRLSFYDQSDFRLLLEKQAITSNHASSSSPYQIEIHAKNATLSTTMATAFCAAYQFVNRAALDSNSLPLESTLRNELVPAK